MDKSRFDFTFGHLTPLTTYKASNDLSLWIFHIDKTPPHVGLSVGEMFFSLKSNGRDEVPTIKLVQTVEKKRIKCIVLNLRFSIGLGEVRRIFYSYDRAVSAKMSCLAPIKHVLNVSENVLKLSELLSYLNDKNMMKEYHGFNVTESELGILSYGPEDIDKRLNLLHA
jgi:hypothetical protein